MVTYLMGEQYYISFGILHFFGVCMILYGLLKKMLYKVPVTFGTPTFLILFFVLKLNSSFYINEQTQHTFLNFTTDIHPDAYVSSDYYPLFPWIFLFLTGTFMGKFLLQYKNKSVLSVIRCSALAYIGRHTMIIYLAHQPIIYGSMWIISNIKA